MAHTDFEEVHHGRGSLTDSAPASAGAFLCVPKDNYMRFSFKKRKDGTIVIVDEKPPKEYARPMYSFSPGGGSYIGNSTPKGIERALGKKYYNWENGGKNIFIQAIFYPASIGNTREDRNEYLESILKWELESN